MPWEKNLLLFLAFHCLMLLVSSQINLPQNNHYGNRRRQFWSPPLPPLDGPLGNRGYHRNLPVNPTPNVGAISPSVHYGRNDRTRPYGLPSKKNQEHPPIPPIPHIFPIPFPIRPDPSLIPQGVLPQQTCHGPHCDHQGNQHLKVWKRRFVYPQRRYNQNRIPFQPDGLNGNSGGEAYGVNYEYGYENPQGK